MATIADASESLSFSNTTLEKMNMRIGILRENTEEEIVPLLRSIDKQFKEFFVALSFQQLEKTDPEDVSTKPEAEEKADDKSAFSLGNFFSLLAEKLIYFVSTLLPALIAAIGLSNLGFTGLELKLAQAVKIFQPEYWKAKGAALKAWIQENKAFKAIRNFFGDGTKAGKFAAFMSSSFAPIVKFFSLSGDGLVAKTFQGIKNFGGKILKVLGKIFFPISLLMSAFDGFLVAGETFEETGGNIVSGIVGFIGGFLASFFGTFLDLIKDGVSWLLGKIFGEDNPVSEFLDSFSIAGFMVDITKGIATFIDDVWVAIKQAVLDMLSDPIGTVTSALKNTFSGEGEEQIRQQNDELAKKMEERRLAFIEEQNKKSAAMDAAKGGSVNINAPNTTNNSSSSSTIAMGTSPSASNPNQAPKRQRGGG